MPFRRHFEAFERIGRARTRRMSRTDLRAPVFDTGAIRDGGKRSVGNLATAWAHSQNAHGARLFRYVVGRPENGEFACGTDDGICRYYLPRTLRRKDRSNGEEERTERPVLPHAALHGLLIESA